MNKEQIFEAFKELFPNWAARTMSYKKIGAKTLVIKFINENDGDKVKSRVFLYIDPDNWQFGTKLWRKRPEHLTKKEEKKDGDK